MKKGILAMSVLFLCCLSLFGYVAYSQGTSLLNKGVLKDGVAMFMVSHTEYMANENYGQIIGKLVDANLDPIDANYCFVDIYNPDKTLYISQQYTDDTLEAVAGTHYINFTTPSVSGVYEYTMTCEYPKTPSLNRNVTTSNSFHLNPALTEIMDLNLTLNAMNVSIENNFVQIKNNLTEIQVDLGQINSTMNTIRGDQFTRAMAQSNFTYTNALINGVVNNITPLLDYCDNPETAGSSLCLWTNQTYILVQDMNNTMNYNNAVLTDINNTINNIYDYLSIDLTSLVNNVFYQVNMTYEVTTQINASVNDIKANTSAIKQQLDEQVYINVFSG